MTWITVWSRVAERSGTDIAPGIIRECQKFATFRSTGVTAKPTPHRQRCAGELAV